MYSTALCHMCVRTPYTGHLELPVVVFGIFDLLFESRDRVLLQHRVTHLYIYVAAPYISHLHMYTTESLT